MLKHLRALPFLLCSSAALAQPYMVSDPVVVSPADVDKTKISCVFQEGAAPPVVTPLVNGGCKASLAGAALGTHNYLVWFRWVDPVGHPGVPEVVSPKATFIFRKPTMAAPAKLREEK